MIQTRDLRLGNYVNCYDEIRKISVLHRVSAYCININGSYSEVHCPCEKLEPVILTEEKLLKCGYIKNIHTGNYVNDISVDELCFTKMVIEFKENIFNFCIVSNNYDCYIIKINYLHELQNLYFSLTGQELSVNL